MTGKFNNSNNGICFTCFILALFAAIIGGAVYITNTGPDEASYFICFFAIAATFLLIIPLRKCAFSADDEKVVFRVAFIKHTYRFSEIHSASTQVGFVHGKYGASARVELVITLSDGDCLKYCDENVPDEALSTPENHKLFQDTHQFTALCRYINERARG